MSKMHYPIDSYLYNSSRYVCPIFSDHDPRLRKSGPVQVGSGTLFCDDSGGYIFTAKHVIDNLPNDKVVIAGSKKLIAINPHQIAYQTKIDHDICVLRLPDMCYEDLSQYYIFSTPADIKNLTGNDGTSCLIWVGFPNSKNKTPYKRKPILENKALYCLSNKLIDINTLGLNGKTKSDHFAIYFDNKKSTMYNSNAEKNFGQKGMSGGGIWQFTIDRITKMVSASNLVGIGIEFYEGRNTIIGTNILSCIYALENFKTMMK